MPSPRPEKKPKTNGKSAKTAARTEKPPSAPQPTRVAFPRKNQPPTANAFAARLPLALGKRFEMARSFLLRQAEVKEDVYYYGPKTGWALRYLAGDQPLCSLLLHGDSPVGIVALDAATSSAVDWKSLSAIGQIAHRN